MEEWCVIENIKYERGSEVSYFDTFEEAEKYADERKEKDYVEDVTICKLVKDVK